MVANETPSPTIGSASWIGCTDAKTTAESRILGSPEKRRRRPVKSAPRKKNSSKSGAPTEIVTKSKPRSQPVLDVPLSRVIAGFGAVVVLFRKSQLESSPKTPRRGRVARYPPSP
jgi:hypothetical protein